MGNGMRAYISNGVYAATSETTIKLFRNAHKYLYMLTTNEEDASTLCCEKTKKYSQELAFIIVVAI
jgi:hypothetical protein